MKLPIRDSYIAVYHGNDFRVFRDGDELYLEGNERNLLSEGFIEKYPGRFYKKVRRSDLAKVFRVTPFVVYRGIEFPVVGYNETEVGIGCSDEKIAKRLNMQIYDRGTYVLSISMERVESYREQIDDIDIP